MTAVICSAPIWLGEQLAEEMKTIEWDGQKMTKTELYFAPNWLGERLAEYI